jgi:hypothetical protein
MSQDLDPLTPQQRYDVEFEDRLHSAMSILRDVEATLFRSALSRRMNPGLRLEVATKLRSVADHVNSLPSV